MHPVLFHVGSYPVTSYGTALMLAFALGIGLAVRRGEARGLDGDRILGVGIVILLTSIVGARLLFVATHTARFEPPLGTWLDAALPVASAGGAGTAGLSMLGGVVLATLAALAYLAWRRQPVLRVADVLAPSVALGEGVTRIGCFLNGCCHGVVCDLPWAVRFPQGSPAALLFPGAAVHPTQLYASLLGFGSFGLLVWLARRGLFDGAVFCAFLVVTGVTRIGLDLVRYSEPEVVVLEAAGIAVTTNQVLSLALVVAGLGGLALLRPRASRAASA